MGKFFKVNNFQTIQLDLMTFDEYAGKIVVNIFLNAFHHQISSLLNKFS